MWPNALHAECIIFTPNRHIKIKVLISLLAIRFALQTFPEAMAAAPGLTMSDLAGSWTANATTQIKVDRLGSVTDRAKAPCLFSANSSDPNSGAFLCYGDNNQPVVEGTLALLKKGKKLSIQFSPVSIVYFEGDIADWIEQTAYTKRLAIDPATINVATERMVYVPLTVKKNKSLPVVHLR